MHKGSDVVVFATSSDRPQPFGADFIRDRKLMNSIESLALSRREVKPYTPALRSRGTRNEVIYSTLASQIYEAKEVLGAKQ